MKERTGKIVTAVSVLSFLGMCYDTTITGCVRSLAESVEEMEIPKSPATAGERCEDPTINVKLEKYFGHQTVRIWDDDGIYTPASWSNGERRVEFIMLEAPRWDRQNWWHVRSITPSKRDEPKNGCSYHLDTVLDRIQEQWGLVISIDQLPYRW